MNEASPLAKTLRHRRNELRLGPGAACGRCGQADPRALQLATVVRCAACRLAEQGQPATERHHPAGRRNDAFAAPLPANAHAALSDAQYDWPAETLRNPDGDFLRTLAGWLRFFADTFAHLSEHALDWATTLERYAGHLTETLGPRWWVAIEEGAQP